MQHNSSRVLKYEEYEHELNVSGIQYPVDIKDIGRFEHGNKIGVNVYGYKEKKIFPLHISTAAVARHHVNLLYITAGEKSHYVLIKDLSRLVSSQYNNHKGKTNLSILLAQLHQTRSIEKPFRKVQVTWGAKNQAPRS